MDTNKRKLEKVSESWEPPNKLTAGAKQYIVGKINQYFPALKIVFAERDKVRIVRNSMKIFR